LSCLLGREIYPKQYLYLNVDWVKTSSGLYKRIRMNALKGHIFQLLQDGMSLSSETKWSLHRTLVCYSHLNIFVWIRLMELPIIQRLIMCLHNSQRWSTASFILLQLNLVLIYWVSLQLLYDIVKKKFFIKKEKGFVV
jgi:hypothetical protein